MLAMIAVTKISILDFLSVSRHKVVARLDRLCAKPFIYLERGKLTARGAIANAINARTIPAS